MDLLLTPNSSLLGKALRLPLRLMPRSMVVTVRDGITKDMKWRVGSSTHGCWLGTYEREKQAMIRARLKPGMNVFDIGANAGFYSLGCARTAAHVWAFEPFAENVRHLLDHVALNRLSNVSIVQAAISNRIGISGFEIGPHNAMGRLGKSEYMVPTLTLDSLMDSIPTPDLVKIDVEGGELAVLSGAMKLLSLRRTIWLVALDAPRDREACRDLLREMGYSVSEFARDEIIAA